LLDPAALHWSSAGTMHTARRLQTATLLPDGALLRAGGVGWSGATPLRDAEMYRPIENLWLPVAPMAAGRDVAGGVLLSNGSAIALGGVSGGPAPCGHRLCRS